MLKFMPTIFVDFKNPEDVITEMVLKKVTECVKQKYTDAEQLLAHYFDEKMLSITHVVLDYMSTEDINIDQLSTADVLDIAEDELIGYSCIECNYFDEDEQCYCVDAWHTDDNNEEGEVIAKVYENKTVFKVDGVFKYLDVLRATEECRKRF